MKRRKATKIVSILCAVVLGMSLLAGCGTQAGNTKGDSNTTEAGQKDIGSDVAENVVEEGATEDEAEQVPSGTIDSDTDVEDAVTVRVGGLSGPTSMGLVKLMEDSADGLTENTYEFAELSSDSSAFVTPLATGEIDIAAVPSNLAAVIYNNTDGAVQVLAVNVLGVLDIVQRGEQVTSLSNLVGKTLYASGQGATPEYTLRYLLIQNGIDPDTDLDIQWCADTTEVLSYVSQDESAVAMLPQPFATVAQAQVDDLSVAIDLNDEWAKLGLESEIVTGVLVVRTEFAQEYPQQLATFLEEYEVSVQYTLDEPEEAATLIEKYIGVSEAVAQAALPNCHLTDLTGVDMRTALEGYLQIIYDMNAASVGGSMPGDDFYYGT